MITSSACGRIWSRTCRWSGGARYTLSISAVAHPACSVLPILTVCWRGFGPGWIDLAYQCMQLRLPDLGGSIVGLQGLDRQALGIPDEARYVERYCERRGLDGMDDWPFYLGFSFFRLGAIAQGVAKRAQQGNASSAEASKVGAMVQPLAQLALASIHAA